MKNHKKLIIIISVIILVVIGAIIGVKLFNDSSRLTIIEKNYIDDNVSASKVITVNVINDANVFGSNGEGVFYDFIKSFQDKYSLKMNPASFSYGQKKEGISFGVKNSINENDLVFYKDHYVLVSNKREIISNTEDLRGKKVLILKDDLSYVSGLINTQVDYLTCDNSEDLFKKIDNENKYAILPLHLYLKDILDSNLEIIYHFSDIYSYYTLSLVDDTLSNILRKYFNTWESDKNVSYNDNLFKLIVNSLNITDTEIDAMRSVEYNYGYINNSPYEVISSGNYGGIVAVYLKGFMDFAGVDFNFTKYRNFNQFNKAINKGKIDVYFGYYNAINDFNKTTGGVVVNYVIAANTKNDIVVNSINSLVGNTVYVDKNSNLYTYLSSYEGINVKTYDNNSKLKRFNHKDEILMIDLNTYEYYHNNGLQNYTTRYQDHLNMVYSFNVKNSSALYKLLNKYVDLVDNNTMVNEGFYNHAKTVKTGSILSIIAKNFIYVVVILALLLLIFSKKTKKIKVAKRIKKDDKMRFIDQLTLLKNRNYLNENINEWNNNTIYPQTLLVIDLNKVKDINDIQGYEEGDKQIKAAANVLIRTQLDNSDIIRTDGNEFVVYLVGYSQKQITNYIHKLNREFKKLPYNYGAEFGYSMILDDIKTIEDALNEATKDIKKQKGLNESKSKDEN